MNEKLSGSARIGHLRRHVSAAEEYKRLATEDEQSARLLLEHGQCRQAMYFVLQSMEKCVRGKIFSIVDPKNKYFRDQQRTHSVEDAIAFLVEVVSSNSQVRQQIKEQLDKYVVSNTRYNLLHNDLRYPAFSDKFECFCCLEVTTQDAEALLHRLDWLKQFLAAI